MKIRKLDHRAQPELYHLLTQQTTVNLFLLERLFLKGIKSWGYEHWFGAYDKNKLVAVSLVMGKMSSKEPARLITVYGSLDGCRLLGEHAARQGGTLIIVGPRKESDALWAGLGEPPLRINKDQQLYSCTSVIKGPMLDIRTAQDDDFEQLVVFSAEMMSEDLDENPLQTNPEHHRNIVKDKIKNTLGEVLSTNHLICLRN